MRPLTIERVELMLRDALDADDSSAISRLSAQLDSLDVQKQPASLIGAALWYAEQGLRVFPLMPLTKRPWPRSHGCHDATTDMTRVREWWEAAPTSNIGIATGHVVDVIDLDGFEANLSFVRRFESDELHARLMRSVLGQVSTPRAGGRHLYVPAQERGNRARARKQRVDYRGAGGYVVAPPSTTDARDGQVSGVYRWIRALEL